MLYKDMGEHATALPLAQQALQLRKDVLGENHPDYATSLNTLAMLYYAGGSTPRPCPCVNRRCSCGKNTWGRTTPSTH